MKNAGIFSYNTAPEYTYQPTIFNFFHFCLFSPSDNGVDFSSFLSLKIIHFALCILHFVFERSEFDLPD